MADTYETLLFEEDEAGVGWLTLNRPEALNSFNSTMQRELHDLWRTLRQITTVRCVVLTGSGDKAFCTGIDRSEIGTTDAKDDRASGYGSTRIHFDDPGNMVGPKSADLWVPVIAAVNGIACGGAFYLLGEVEFVIAADTATFFDPHLAFGLTAGFESVHIMQKMHFQEAMRMALLGGHERLSAERAMLAGLVTEVVPPGELRARAQWAAEAVASAPPLPVQATVRAMWAAREVGRTQALATASAYVAIGNDRAAMLEGQAAWASGRRPEWQLR